MTLARDSILRFLRKTAPSRWLALGLAVLSLAGIAWLLTMKKDVGFAPGETVEIAVVYPDERESTDFLTGVQIAIDQINASGGLLGHPVAAKLFKEENYTDKVLLEKLVSQTLRLASGIGKTRSILAVVGHGSSATAIPASAVYNRYGKLFLATHATATSLSNLHLDLTFAMQPNNADNAGIMADYARSQGLGRMVVLSDNSNYGIETTNQFRSKFSQNGGEVLLHGRLSSSNLSVDDLLLYILDNNLFKSADIDGFFITSSSYEETAHFILRARRLGLTVPILGPEYLYSHQVEDLVGPKAMQGVAAVSVFDEQQVTPEGKLFAQIFQQTAGHPPGLVAAVGFDAVTVLSYAVRKSGSLAPKTIADTLRILRYEAPYMGATGPVVFDASGLITDTAAYVVRHDGTRFQTVATFSTPLSRRKDASRREENATIASERNPPK